MLEQSVQAQRHDPFQRYRTFTRELNYGKTHLFKPVDLSDLRRLDAAAACRHFSQAFHNPAEFTVCFVGTPPLPLAAPCPRVPKALAFARREHDLRGHSASAGNIDEVVFRDLVVRYLASIPAVEAPVPRQLAAVTPVPFAFPSKPVHAAVPLSLAEPKSLVQVTFPVQVRSVPSAVPCSACL